MKCPHLLKRRGCQPGYTVTNVHADPAETWREILAIQEKRTIDNDNPVKWHELPTAGMSTGWLQREAEHY
ncbi:hypothetical protein ABIE65_000031 [Constrictibacter sp. MBR-5]|uniref:hypothetical protein n=1 Tax=Constrictibacter sp. MBR-5 TaxID=3156467 RepID=UPI003399E5FD